MKLRNALLIAVVFFVLGAEPVIRDFRLPIMPAIRPGMPLPQCTEAPDELAVLPYLKAKSERKKRYIADIHVAREKVEDELAEPRFYPLVGPAQVHRCKWKCTVSYLEVTYVTFLITTRIEQTRTEVVFVNQDHLHRPGERLGLGPETLTSPCRAAQWAVASPHHIQWDATSFVANAPVKLEFSADGGKSWQEFAAAAPNTGRFLWKVPDKVSADCRLRLSSGGKTVESAKFAVIPSQQVGDYEWVQVTKKAEFAPRDGAGALVFAGRMWLLGGWNPGDKKNFPRICNNEVWSSKDGATWALDKPNTFLDRNFDPRKDWEGRHTAGYVVFKDKMWIVGGDVNQGHYHADVWSSADGKSWTLVNDGKPVPWGPRALHYTLAFKDKIWVMGGQTIPQFAKADELFHRDIWNSADGITWERVTPKEPFWPQRGMIGGSVVFKERMWLLGGGTYDTPKIPTRKFFNDVWSSADGVTWERHAELAPWEPRQYHEVAVFDGRLWVLEGYYKGNRNDVWYSADGVNWYDLPNTPWKPRHAASVFVHAAALWMVAGNNMESDAWKLRRKPP